MKPPPLCRICRLIFLGAILFAARSAVAQGVNDGFAPSLNSNVLALALQPDGKILIGGNFTLAASVLRTNLARVTVDGLLDAGFIAHANGAVSSLAVQADGRILVGGSFTTLGGQPRVALARLETNGVVDGTFQPDPNGTVRALAFQPDGRILVGGEFTTIGGQSRSYLCRLNSDGTVDADFDAPADGFVRSLVLLRDGRILVGGFFSSLAGARRTGLARLEPDGRLDADFNPRLSFANFSPDPVVYALAVQADGKTVAGGDFFTDVDPVHEGLVRLNGDGSVDADFHGDVVAGVVHALAVQADGKVVVGGMFGTLDGMVCTNLGRLNVDGTLDTAFTTGANNQVRQLLTQPDGKLLVGGIFTTLGGTNRNRIGRLYPDGSVDATLLRGAGLSVATNLTPILTIVLQPDGRILLGSERQNINNVLVGGLERLTPSGTMDTGFNAGVNGGVGSILVQPDGKIVVGGGFSTLGGGSRRNIGRLNADGTLDESFVDGTNGSIRCMALLPDGKLLVSYDFSAYGLFQRLNADGTLDPTFVTLVTPGQVSRIALRADGKILVGGNFGSPISPVKPFLARLESDGTMDSSFHTQPNNLIGAMAIQPDGKLLLSGNFTAISGVPRSGLARLNQDDTVDMSFEPILDRIYGVFDFILQTDGKIIIAGSFFSVNGQGRGCLARLNPDGSLDPGFDLGAFTGVNTATVQPDGKVLAGGPFPTTSNFDRREYIARLPSGAATRETLALDSSGTALTWTRRGGGPEIQQATFELSLDGVNYSLLGNGVRASNGWALTNLSLPFGQNFHVRARGRSLNGDRSPGGSLIESVAQFWRLPPPFLSSLRVLGGGTFQFDFTNTNAVAWTVLASTNVASLPSSWESLGSPMSLGGGVYQFSDPQAAAHSSRFYQLKTP